MYDSADLQSVPTMMSHNHNPCPQSKSTRKETNKSYVIVLFVAFIVFLNKKGCRQNIKQQQQIRHIS